MVVGVADQYLVLIAITLLFTVLSLIFDEEASKHTMLQYFAGTLWLISAFGHFTVGDTSSILTYAVTYLFLGFAFLFYVAAMYNSFFIIKAHRSGRV